MESKRVLLLVCYLIVAAALLSGASATTYTVGDKLGWTIPPLGDVAYKTWAAGKDFAIGDTLVFTWNSTHTVAQLTSQSDYDNCNAANTIGAIQTSSPATFTINSTGSHYFICTVASHCSLGQKVTVTVGSSAASATSSALTATLFAMAIFFLSIM